MLNWGLLGEREDLRPSLFRSPTLSPGSPTVGLARSTSTVLAARWRSSRALERASCGLASRPDPERGPSALEHFLRSGTTLLLFESQLLRVLQTDTGGYPVTHTWDAICSTAISAPRRLVLSNAKLKLFDGTAIAPSTWSSLLGRAIATVSLLRRCRDSSRLVSGADRALVRRRNVFDPELLRAILRRGS